MNFLIIKIAGLLLLVLAGCSTQEHSSPLRNIEINGRDEEALVRHPIYQAKIPPNWILSIPSPNESIADTKKSLCEFIIQENTQEIKITIHNFPSDNLSQRIPPMAQIHRWQRQFTSLSPTSLSINPQSFGGFSGLLFEGTGLLTNQDNTTTMLGWSMQIAPEHYRYLSFAPPDKMKHFKQMRADYTIKAVGPENLILKHKKDIMTFARSFELIEEIDSQW